MIMQDLRDILELVSIFGSNFILLIILSFILIKYRKVFLGISHFIRDWSGSSAEPGRSRIPGVMERLNEIDGQLKNNGGTSIKDAVDRIEIRVGEIDDRLADGDRKFDDIHNELKRIKNKKI